MGGRGWCGGGPLGAHHTVLTVVGVCPSAARQPSAGAVRGARTRRPHRRVDPNGLLGGELVVQLVALTGGGDEVDLDGPGSGASNAADPVDRGADGQVELSGFMLGGLADTDGLLEVGEGVTGVFEASIDPARPGVLLLDGGAGGEVAG